MLSNTSNEPQASSRPNPQAIGTAQTAGAVLDPHSPIEVASQGTGTGNDPVGTDNKPPGVYDGGDSLA